MPDNASWQFLKRRDQCHAFDLLAQHKLTFLSKSHDVEYILADIDTYRDQFSDFSLCLTSHRYFALFAGEIGQA